MTKDPKAWIKTAVGIALLMVSCSLPLAKLCAQPVAVVQEEPDGPVYLGGQVLIQFKPDATDAQLLDAVRRGGLSVIKHIHTGAMKAKNSPGITHMWTGLPVRQTIQALKNHPAVEFAEPNWVYTHQDTSNDPYFTGGSLWGMDGDQSAPANQYGSQAAEAWGAGHIGSGSVVVGVIDEGIQFTHPDLAANIWTNPYDSVDGFDNDGNSYVDDIHGWNFVDNNNVIYTSGNDSHGTHVSGTIGAMGGNGLGVVGINWNVTIISGKFLGPAGGSTADAIEAVDYFTKLKITHPEMNLVALNNSWGGGGFSQALLDAIVRAAQQNILFVAAAGNGDFRGRAINTDSSPSYPSCYNTTAGAGYDSVISVTAIDSAGSKASWANYGATTVDLGAPGVGIYSTLPDTYGSYSGTSMATPHVTGAAALYASTHPGATALQIKNALLGSTTPTASLAGKTVTGGRLNLSEIITPPPPAPTTAPIVAAAAVSSSQIDVSWTYDVGDQTGFKVLRSTDDANFTVVATVGAAVRSFSNTGLSVSTTYYYRMIAYNTGGDSPASVPSVSATTEAVPPIPAVPSGLIATAASISQIDLSWIDNSENESGFKIEISSNGTSFTQIGTVGANVTAYSSTGLSRNKTYYYRVRAYNAGGNSVYSNTASARTLKN